MKSSPNTKTVRKDQDRSGARALGAKVAGRDKDIDFLHEAAKHQMADPEILLRRLETVEATAAGLPESPPPG